MERKLSRRRLLGAASAFAGGSALAGAAGAAVGATAAKAANVTDPIPALDDAEILVLFAQWLDVCRELDGFGDDIPDDEPRWNELCDRQHDIESSIFECRGGAIGLAVKTFLHLYREFANWTPLSEQIRLEGDEQGITPSWVVSLLRDAADVVPEIGECAAAIIHEDAALIEADMDIEWTERYGRLDSPYERPEWRLRLRQRLRAKRELIATTAAKTARGEAIKARHAGVVA
jgi:hypothetical protein